MEIDENFSHQLASWRVQRAVWWGMLLFAAAAALGLTGSGPLNHAEARLGSMTVQYSPFGRLEKAQILDLRPVEGYSGESLRIMLDRPCLEGHIIQPLAPTPREEAAGAAGIVYVFATAPASATPIAFQLVPKRPGRVSCGVTVDGQRATFAEWIWP